MDEKVMDKAYALVEEIQSMEVYKTLKRLDREIRSNEEVQALIADFKQCEKDYREAERHGEHHPDIARYRRRLSVAKRALHTHPLVKEYKQAEKELQAYLDGLSERIAGAVSPRIQTDTLKGGITCKTGKV